MPLLIKCSSPFAAPRHPHLRAPPHVCCHVCRAHARPCLSTGWALNRRFDQLFGTAAVLAQGGGGVSRQNPLQIFENTPMHKCCKPSRVFVGLAPLFFYHGIGLFMVLVYA